MNILTIFTGGTIGSSIKDGYINTHPDNMQKLIDTLPDTDIVFDIKNPYTILSENLNGEHLSLLIKEIKTALSENKYDGIIVTHGTDTLQYTAAMLGLIFYSCGTPIVLVSSNYILDDSRANGAINFANAVAFIKRYNLVGKADTTLGNVFVSYGNTDPLGRIFGYIHRATRVLPHQPYSDHIYSINNTFYGQFISEGSFVLNSTDTAAITASFESNKILSNEINIHTNAPVMYIKATPGMIYPEIPCDIKCILLEGYHSGTLCTNKIDSNQLINFTENAKQKNIPVFLTGMSRGIAYESTASYEKLGIRVLQPASPITMYCKAWIIVDNNMSTDLLNIPFADEFV